MNVECIITGCALVVESHRHYWGDLHRLGDVLIFNAVLSPKGEAEIIEAEPNKKFPVVTVDDSHRYFEQRGVFVIHEMFVSMNGPALNRINWER